MRRLFARVPLAGWALVATAAVLVGGYFAFHALFVKVSRSVEQPFSGPARHNEYYVLERYLEERGLKVRMVRDWPQPIGASAALFWFTDDDVPHDVRAWLAAGGQLWSYRDPDAALEEWEPTPWHGDAGDAGVAAEAPAAESASVAGASDAGVEADAGIDVAALVDAYDEHWCDQGCLDAAQFRYGDGCLTLVGLYPLQNEQVHLGETPERIDALLTCPRRPGEVVIVTSVGSPWFGQLLVQHAPGALLAFAALLLLSLWRAGFHFGPKLPPKKRERRQMLEHISAVGTLALRVGVTPLLVSARRELLKQLLRRVPHAAGLGSEAQISAIAEVTELSTRDVERALVDDPGESAALALGVARAMQTLWRKT